MNLSTKIYRYNVVSNSTHTDTVKLEIISSDRFYESIDSTTSVVPAANTQNVSFSIPVFIGLHNIGWQTIPISFTTSKTSVSFRPATTSDPGRKNIITWEFHRFAGIDKLFTTSSTPEIDSNGVAGRGIFYYVMGVSNDTTVTVGAIGTSVLSCVDNWTYYIDRPYNVSAIAASTMVIGTK